MNVLDIDDSIIETAHDRGVISDWDRQFFLGLVNFAELSEKQETKKNLIIKKLQREGFLPVGATAKQVSSATRFCPHCGERIA